MYVPTSLKFYSGPALLKKTVVIHKCTCIHDYLTLTPISPSFQEHAWSRAPPNILLHPLYFYTYRHTLLDYLTFKPVTTSSRWLSFVGYLCLRRDSYIMLHNIILCNREVRNLEYRYKTARLLTFDNKLNYYSVTITAV